jgi:hypothetical protein
MQVTVMKSLLIEKIMRKSYNEENNEEEILNVFDKVKGYVSCMRDSVLIPWLVFHQSSMKFTQ